MKSHQRFAIKSEAMLRALPVGMRGGHVVADMFQTRAKLARANTNTVLIESALTHLLAVGA